MTFLDVAGPCTAATAARTRTRAIVGGWVNAGWRAGLCLGAALGAGILLIGGAASRRTLSSPLATGAPVLPLKGLKLTGEDDRVDVGTFWVPDSRRWCKRASARSMPSTVC
jgi:hypothetical protein